MKRSEAERLISDHLCHYMYEELAKRRAKEVLDIMLEVGMLPPGRDLEMSNDGGFYETFVYWWEAE